MEQTPSNFSLCRIKLNMICTMRQWQITRNGNSLFRADFLEESEESTPGIQDPIDFTFFICARWR